jgi:hypothetical protein
VRLDPFSLPMNPKFFFEVVIGFALQTTFSRPKQNVILAKSRLPVKHFLSTPKKEFQG